MCIKTLQQTFMQYLPFFNLDNKDSNLKKHQAYRNMFISTMKMIRYGELTVTTPEGEELVFKGKESGPIANIKIKDWMMVKRLITRGDVGFAEDFIDGTWETDDLPALLTQCTMNISELDNFFHGHWWSKVLFAFINFVRSNTKRGSKKNIQAHYDLGNDFYELWLDDTMTYSSAYFADGKNETLEEAQVAKYQLILDKLGGKPGDKILEIGCGWGGFAETAAKQGYHVTGLTLSEEQANYARERMKREGLEDKVEIRLMDYRDAKEKYDFVVSIEMFEAVGERFWPIYFSTVKSVLKKGGKAVIQTITIDNDIFDEYKKRSDFIQQYTFPGGALPSQFKFIEAAEKEGLKSHTVFAFGYDYARTLRNWLVNVDGQIEAIRKLGYNDKFIRSWRFYLCYCIAGFTTRRTNVIQAELINA